MGKYKHKDIEYIANHLRRRKEDDKKPFNLLTGAGCSLSAGIPLAPTLTKKINELFKDDCERKLSQEQCKDYGSCMSILSKDERKQLLGEYLDEAQVNWAHLAIASLLKEGYIGRVLTFNFDSILARACGMIGIYPATYDFVSGVTKQTAYIADRAILHLHGQGHSMAMMNSEKETKEHAQNLGPLFRAMFEQSSLLIAGYSGQSDEVYPVMKREFTGQHRVFWADYRDDPNKTIQDFIANSGPSNEYFGGADADRFFIELAQQLECWPPKLFTDPDNHILGMIDLVCDYPVADDSETDILATLKNRLTARNKDQAIEISEAELMAMQGDWDKVKTLISADTEDEDEQDLLSWAYITEASKLIDDSQDPKRYEQAFEKYEQAVAIKPDKHEALYNWGVALGALAKLTDEPKLYKQACEKYEQAVAIKPDKHEALNNWGADLLILYGVSQKLKYLVEAEKVLLRAKEIDSIDLYNLACVYSRQGKEKQAQECLEICKKAKTLPSKDHLLKDLDMEPIIDKASFKALISDLPD